MNMLLGFVPFAVFALSERIFGVVGALAASAATSMAIVVRDAVSGRTPKLLELGSTMLFGSLALWAYVEGNSWSILDVRLRIDAGLFLIVVLSLLLRRPFTLAYARERIPVELWTSPVFLRANDVISSAWAGAFLVIGLADIAMVYAPSIPIWIGIVITLAVLAAAFVFTSWYPEHAKATN